MENVASLAILLALYLAVYAIVASVAGRRKPLLALSAYRAVYAVWFLVTLASAILLYAFLTDDFRLATVASHSNRSLTLSYKIAAWWGGQEGSLLFWSWLLSCYTAVALFMHRRGPRDSMPYTVAILMSTQAFFLVLNAFVASPFQVIGQNGLVVAVPDGVGLNPLLQNPL